MLLRRIVRAALANCGETINSFIEIFRGKEERGLQAMRRLLVHRSWTKISDVLRDESNLKPEKNPVSISKPFMLAAADLFYGQNIFVAESLNDLEQFAGAVEPTLLHHVRHIVFEEPLLWRSPEQTRYANNLTIEDQILMVIVGKFTGLEQITFNVSWDFEGPQYGHTIRQICSVAPGLRRIEIRRPESLGDSPNLGTRMYLLDDDRNGTQSINTQLEARWQDMHSQAKELDAVA